MAESRWPGDGRGSENGTRSGVTEPAHQGSELTTLLGFLQRQRDLVSWKLAGASDPALRAVSTPTGMTAYGIVRHLGNVERSWFRHQFAGQSGLTFDWTDDDPDAEWKVPASVSMATLLAAYQAECAACDEVIEAASLDALGVNRPMSLRWMIVHLIEETGRHLGHLDLLREQADGVVGEEP